MMSPPMSPISLPPRIAERIDSLSEQGNALLEGEGDWRGAVAAWRSALAALPDPKSQWEAWSWLNASIGEALRVGGDLGGARAAFVDASNGPEGYANPFILLRLGQTLVDLGEEAEGCERLLRAYMLEGDEIFAEDGASYLAILKRKGLIP